MDIAPSKRPNFRPAQSPKERQQISDPALAAKLLRFPRSPLPDFRAKLAAFRAGANRLQLDQRSPLGSIQEPCD
ncbi:MAG TPA: hypothetical protein VG269_07445 [Tepidisphaeraceae bacterium]|nr:hypothetical protein [Tepidisphaeraceae bacterium]